MSDKPQNNGSRVIKSGRKLNVDLNLIHCPQPIVILKLLTLNQVDPC